MGHLKLLPSGPKKVPGAEQGSVAVRTRLAHKRRIGNRVVPKEAAHGVQLLFTSCDSLATAVPAAATRQGAYFSLVVLGRIFYFNVNDKYGFSPIHHGPIT